MHFKRNTIRVDGQPNTVVHLTIDQMQHLQCLHSIIINNNNVH